MQRNTKLFHAAHHNNLSLSAMEAIVVLMTWDPSVLPQTTPSSQYANQ